MPKGHAANDNGRAERGEHGGGLAEMIRTFGEAALAAAAAGVGV